MKRNRLFLFVLLALLLPATGYTQDQVTTIDSLLSPPICVLGWSTITLMQSMITGMHLTLHG